MKLTDIFLSSILQVVNLLIYLFFLIAAHHLIHFTVSLVNQRQNKSGRDRLAYKATFK